MRLSDEDFDSLNVDGAKITAYFEIEVGGRALPRPTPIFEPIIENYKETGNIRSAMKKMRRIIVAKLEEEAESLGLEEDEDADDISDRVNKIFTEQLALGLLQPEVADVGALQSKANYEKILNSIFSGVRYEQKKITFEVFTGQKMESSKFSLLSKEVQPEDLERRYKKKEKEFPVDFESLMEYENAKENFEAAKVGVQKASDMRSKVERSNIKSVLEIRDPVLSLLGGTSKTIITRKDSIYRGWKEVSGKFADLEKANKALIAKFKSPNAQEKKFKEVAEKLENYVEEYSQQAVPVKEKERVALDLIFTFLKKYGKIVEEAEERDSTLGVGEMDLSQKDIQDTEQAYNDKVDPITKYYLTKMLDGVFVPKASAGEIKEMIRTFIREDLPALDTDDFNSLDRFINDIPDIDVYKGEAFLPVQFAPMLNVKELKDKAGPINDNYEDYLRALGGLIEEGSYRMGSSTIHNVITGGTDFGSERDYRYSARSTPRQMEFRETSYAEELKAVLQALQAYLFTPTQNPLLSLGYSFQEIRKPKEFKILSVYAANSLGEENMSTQAISSLYDRYQKRPRAAMFTNKQLKVLETFLVGLRRNFTFDAMEKNLEAVYQSVIKPVYRKAGSGFLDRTHRAFGKWTASIFNKLFEKGEYTHPSGVTSAEVKNAEVEVDDVLELEAFLELKDFIINNKDRISTSSTKKTLNNIINEFNTLMKSKKLRNRILDAHDAFRILKGFPIYYARGDIDSVTDVSFIIDKIHHEMGLNVVATDIVKMVEEVDSFANIATEVGLSEEVVYFTKAHFR